jgi:hypothetical protein
MSTNQTLSRFSTSLAIWQPLRSSLCRISALDDPNYGPHRGCSRAALTQLFK